MDHDQEHDRDHVDGEDDFRDVVLWPARPADPDDVDQDAIDPDGIDPA
ncbi:hypothetical protein [Embleya sp. NPDC020886]